MATKRLLLVEDDRALAELVKFHFERAGYHRHPHRRSATKR